MSGALYLFKANNSTPIYYLVGEKKVRVRNTTELAEMGFGGADVHVLQPTHPLLTLFPTANP